MGRLAAAQLPKMGGEFLLSGHGISICGLHLPQKDRHDAPQPPVHSRVAHSALGL